jgi:hypothetical protein
MNDLCIAADAGGLLELPDDQVWLVTRIRSHDLHLGCDYPDADGVLHQSLASTLRKWYPITLTLWSCSQVLYFPLDANDHPEMDTSDDLDIG